MAGLTVAIVVGASLVAGCSTSERPRAAKPATKEYFAESEYGVKASPRVSYAKSGLPRGGGRDQLGKPYKVRGKWYTPKEDADYRNTGLASWYGDAFHGRLTANGEIYDMTHLTAAHPTMPLPSYARVTNKANGHSIIVRVNDRGPYAHGRIIDLSRKAAELLDYTHHGVTKVDVEYVGRAPLHGQDEAYLMASYKPGNAAPDPSDGLPSGVMIAMNGPTPTSQPGFSAFSAMPAPEQASSVGVPVLPDLGPIAPERPGVDLARSAVAAALSYAPIGTAQPASVAALDQLAAGGDAHVNMSYVAVGTYQDTDTARAVAAALDTAGIASVEGGTTGDGYSVLLRSDGGGSIDDMLRAAWAAGATDALVVRD